MMILYTDGGCSPSKGTYGSFRLEDKDGVMIKLCRMKFEAPIVTNNGAEYAALIGGLQYCVKENIKVVQCFTDSMLMVNQVNGTWGIKKPHLLELSKEIWELMENFDIIKLDYIKRKFIVAKLGH